MVVAVVLVCGSAMLPVGVAMRFLCGCGVFWGVGVVCVGVLLEICGGVKP